ncbi:MAG: ribosome-associated translation inhibitor RaiA [Prevotella sp.]|nr:ribosome-associated translation inhibitor RaiA [Prevotella sp.]
MEIKIQSIHFDATEKLQAFIDKKVAKLEKSYDIQKVEVVLKVVKPATALNKEVSLTAFKNGGGSLRVEKVCDTFEEAIDLGVDSLKVQLQKNKEKSRDY